MQSALLIFQVDYDFVFITYERYIMLQALNSYLKYRSKDSKDMDDTSFLISLEKREHSVIERTGAFIGTGASYRSNTMDLIAMVAAYGEPNIFETLILLLLYKINFR